jgi:hypothetical protein
MKLRAVEKKYIITQVEHNINIHIHTNMNMTTTPTTTSSSCYVNFYYIEKTYIFQI